MRRVNGYGSSVSMQKRAIWPASETPLKRRLIVTRDCVEISGKGERRGQLLKWERTGVGRFEIQICFKRAREVSTDIFICRGSFKNHSKLK